MKLVHFQKLIIKLFLASVCSLSHVASADDATVLAQTCSACHGQAGVSLNPNWPHLAGQKQGYLIQEITALRDGTREEPSMLPFVADLTDAQVTVLAEYYAGQKKPGKPEAEAINASGENIRAHCMSCHGVAGTSVNQQWPNIAGQPPAYLLKQLRAFKDGSRSAPLMNIIANEYTDQQLRDVAEYYSQLAY